MGILYCFRGKIFL